MLMGRALHLASLNMQSIVVRSVLSCCKMNTIQCVKICASSTNKRDRHDRTELHFCMLKVVQSTVFMIQSNQCIKTKT